MLGVEIIYGNVPSKANSYRTNKGGGFRNNDKVKQYEKDFLKQCVMYRNKLIGVRNIGKRKVIMKQCSFGLEIDVYYSSDRSDLDNSFKVILDCLQKVKAIENDNKCYEIIARKHIDREVPRIEYKLYEIG